MLLAHRDINVANPASWPGIVTVKLTLVALLLVLTVLHDLVLGPKVSRVRAIPESQRTAGEQTIFKTAHWLHLSLFIALGCRRCSVDAGAVLTFPRSSTFLPQSLMLDSAGAIGRLVTCLRSCEEGLPSCKWYCTFTPHYPGYVVHQAGHTNRLIFCTPEHGTGKVSPQVASGVFFIGNGILVIAAAINSIVCIEHRCDFRHECCAEIVSQKSVHGVPSNDSGQGLPNHEQNYTKSSSFDKLGANGLSLGFKRAQHKPSATKKFRDMPSSRKLIDAPPIEKETYDCIAVDLVSLA
jgi:hypothetical protein